MSEIQKVSIAVCTYNGEKYLREQLDSLLNQTYPIFEIVIQDDCSKDGTWNIIEEYVTKYPELIRGIRNERNLDWNQNFYAAIMNCTGDYIALCDQDDYWMPNKIELQMQDIGDTMLNVCSSYYWRGEELLPRINKSVTLEHMALYFEYCGHQFLMKKEMRQYIPFAKKIDMAHDRYFAMVAQYFSSISVSDRLLVKWRRHDTNTTGDLVVDSTSSMQKIKFAARSLVKRGGGTSVVISRAGKKYYDLFKYLYEKDKSVKHSREIMIMWRCLMQQKLIGYIKVGLILYKMRKELGWNYGFKTLYSAMTYPFKWWYIHQKDL